MSEGLDPDIALLRNVNNQLAEEETIFTGTAQSCQHFHGMDIAELYTPLRSIVDSSSPYDVPVKINQLRVETPLVPPFAENGDGQLRATSVAKILGAERSKLPVWPGSTTDNPSSETTIRDAMDMIKPLAEAAISRIEQDRLIESDTTLRANVPIVSIPPVVVPWNARLDLLRQVKMDGLKCFQEWPGISKLERQLIWKPFPKRLAEIAVEEKIDKLDYVGGILEYMTLEDVATSDSIAWKQEGLRILDTLEQDDEVLKPGEFLEEEKGIDFLVRKRKAEQTLDPREPIVQALPANGRHLRVDGLLHAATTSMTQELDVLHPKRHKTTCQEVPQSTISNRNALEMFLALKGITSAQLESPKIDPRNTNPNSIPSQDSGRASYNPQPDQTGEVSSQKLLVKLPTLPSELPRRFAVISSIMLQKRRSLSREIESRYPECEFIEREFSTLRGTFHSDKSSINFDPGEEVDLVISPSTGILLTTIQKIQQRSLPGQGTQQNTFFRRLSQEAIKYERVIVLVSQGAVEDSNVTLRSLAVSTNENGAGCVGHVQRDIESASEVNTGVTQAIASLMTFAATLATDVYVQLVLGGKKNLAAWIAHHIYASGTSHRMLADESLWEQILRRAGLNAFAASMILTVLQQPNADDATSASMPGRMISEEFGLAALLKMDPESRVTRFEKLLGGRSVLQRVNACLEREWLSESTGFRSGRTKLRYDH
jgi:hypothetical protein